MRLAVGVLEIKQKQVDVLHKRGKARGAGIARRFCGNVDALRPRGIGKRRGKLCLLQYLAAGERHAAAGFVIKGLILAHLAQDLLYGIFPAGVGLVLHGVRDGSVAVLRFRVGAPFALQRAALEKNRSSDAGTVVDTEFLNVEQFTCHAPAHPFLICAYYTGRGWLCKEFVFIRIKNIFVWSFSVCED